MAYIAPPTAEQKVQAGYLALCSPQAAYDWLEGRAPKTSSETRDTRSLWNDTADLAKYILLQRRDRLIDLGLARFAQTERAVRRAYMRGDAACRIAAWSNVSARGSSLMADIWATEGDLARLVARGHDDELATMSANPALGESVLSAMVGRKGLFADVTDRRWITCMQGLARNPRLKEEYGPDRPMDGYAEYTHNKVFTEVWGLAASLPATQDWAALLSQVLQTCRLPSGMGEQAEGIVDRWRIDRERVPDEKYYSPGPSFYLRSRLADLMKPDAALLGSEDRVVRLSFWKRFDPRQHPEWVDAMHQVFMNEDEKDAQDALTHAMWNERLWQTEATRQELRALCWVAPDHRHDMMMPNTFQAHLRRSARDKPEWFRDAEPSKETTEILSQRTGDQPEPAWASALAAKVDVLAARLPAPTAAPPAARPGGLQSIPAWVWWVALVAVGLAWRNWH